MKNSHFDFMRSWQRQATRSTLPWTMDHRVTTAMAIAHRLGTYMRAVDGGSLISQHP
jgi:hypothetical protein